MKSAIKFEPVAIGFWAEVHTSSGRLTTTIDQQGTSHRICFASCTGAASHLQDKVLDPIDFEACKRAVMAVETELSRRAVKSAAR